MDFSILYWIQGLRAPFLDSFFVVLTNIAGNYGHIWVILGIILLFFKKTRKCGITVLVSYLLVFGIGQYVLKDWIARPRPCHLDDSVELLVKRPSSYSCPSTHSAWAFAATTSVFLYHKGWGALTCIVALLIAFSRLYLFVHFPTDVLFGMGLGILLAFVSFKIVETIFKKKEFKEKKKL